MQTSDLRMVWDTALGAGLAEVNSEEEANSTVNCRGDSARYNVFAIQVNDGSWPFERDGAGTLPVVEASPARVELRQLYDYTAQLHLDPDMDDRFLPPRGHCEHRDLRRHVQHPGRRGPLPKGETTCSNQTFGRTFDSAGRADAANLLWLVTDDDNTYGDMLALIENDPCAGRAAAGCFFRDREVRQLRVRELGDATRSAIVLDEGAVLLSYVGHGGTTVWSSRNLMSSGDTALVRAQSRQAVMLTLNCLNGYFVAPNVDALAEALFAVEGRGTIAAVSPSGLSLDEPAHVFHRALVAELTSGGHARLGDSLLAAQGDYLEAGLMPSSSACITSLVTRPF